MKKMVASFLFVLGCSGGGEEPAQEAPREVGPRFTPTLPADALPEPLRALRFGDSTPDHALAVLAAPRLRTYESMERYDIGGGVMVSASYELARRFNTNPRWPHALGASDPLAVQNDADNAIPFVDRVEAFFGAVPGRDGMRLVRVDVRAATGAGRAGVMRHCGWAETIASTAQTTACPSAALARLRESMAGSEPLALTCLGDEEGDLLLGVWCTLDGMVMEVIDPASASPRPPVELSVTAPDLAPVVASAMPPDGPGFASRPDGYVFGEAPAIACSRGSYTLTGLTLSHVAAHGTCELTLVDTTITSHMFAVTATGDARVTLRNCTVSVDRHSGGTRGALDLDDRAQVTVDGGSVTGSPDLHNEGQHTAWAWVHGGTLTVRGATLTGWVSRDGTEPSVVDGGGNTGFQPPR